MVFIIVKVVTYEFVVNELHWLMLVAKVKACG